MILADNAREVYSLECSAVSGKALRDITQPRAGLTPARGQRNLTRVLMVPLLRSSAGSGGRDWGPV